MRLGNRSLPIVVIKQCFTTRCIYGIVKFIIVDKLLIDFLVLTLTILSDKTESAESAGSSRDSFMTS